MNGLRPYLDEAVDYEQAWRDIPPDDERRERTRELLDEPLSMDTAVEVALLNHPGLQAQLQNIEIVEHTLRAATVLRNPLLAAESYIFELGQEEPQRLQTFLSFDLSALLERPARVRATTYGIETTRAQVAGEILDFIDEVRRAWIRHVAALELFDYEETLLAQATSDGQAAEIYFDAGELTESDLYRARAFIADARQNARRAEDRVFNTRQDLHDLLGIDVYEILWTVPLSLPPPPEEIRTTEFLEPQALRRNLAIHQFELRRHEQDALLSVARWRRWFPGISLGMTLDFDVDGVQVGPSAGIGIPIFNRFRHTRNALEAERIQLANAQRQEIRQIHFATRRIEQDLRQSHRAALQYPDEILPLRERIVEETKRQFQERQVGIFALLEARRDRFRAERDYVQAQRDFWLAGASFEYLISGGPITATDQDRDIRQIAPLRIEGVRRPR